MSTSSKYSKIIKDNSINTIYSSEDMTDNDNTESNENSEADLKSYIDVDKFKKIPELSSLDPEVIQQLMDMSFPSSEMKIEENAISEVEKFIHFEFFEGRPTKTPARYLKVT